MILHAHLRALFELWSEASERTACTLQGNCMPPILREGDSLLIQHGTGPVRVGDVVVFVEREALVVQRVVRVDKRDGRNEFLVKADQRTSFHGPITRDQILGRVVEARGSNGHLRFDSALWRKLNYALALRSYISGRRLAGATTFWKAVNGLFHLRSKVLPGRLSIGLLPYRVICRAHRIRRRGQSRKPHSRTEE